MGEFSELVGGAETLQGIGGKVAGAAEESAAAIKALVMKIAAAEAGKPWGTKDDTAKSVEDTYNKATEGGTFAQAVNDQSTSLVDEGVEIGPTLITAAAEYGEQDMAAGAQIKNVHT